MMTLYRFIMLTTYKSKFNRLTIESHEMLLFILSSVFCVHMTNLVVTELTVLEISDNKQAIECNRIKIKEVKT